jgi:hypothetical protein
MCSEIEAGIFTLVYSVLLSVGKIVLEMTETLWKNSLIIAKYVSIIHVNVIVIGITFSEKNGGANFVPPLVHTHARTRIFMRREQRRVEHEKWYVVFLKTCNYFLSPPHLRAAMNP